MMKSGLWRLQQQEQRQDRLAALLQALLVVVGEQTNTRQRRQSNENGGNILQAIKKENLTAGESAQNAFWCAARVKG